MFDQGEHIKRLNRKVAGTLKPVKEEANPLAKSFVATGGESRASELNLEGMTAKQRKNQKKK